MPFSTTSIQARELVAEECLSRSWAPVFLLLLSLASMAWSVQAAELRIGNAHGYPGDTVELLLSLQGDGATVSANFLIERSYVADFSSSPATLLAPGVSCTVEGSRFRVIWNGAANNSLIDICIIRMTIRNSLLSNPSIFGHFAQCRDANHVDQACSIASGHIDAVHEFERSFIVVLREPPAAPSLQEVVDFDYTDSSTTAPLGFVDAVRPERVSGGTNWLQTAYAQWILANPQSPISLLTQRGARFTFTTLEQREQALALARTDPAVRDIVAVLGLAGPKLTYPVIPRENQPFGLYLVGPVCPNIGISTPESRSIDIVGNQIEIILHYDSTQVCPTLPPGYSTAVVQIPGVAAGTYTVNIETASGQRSFPLVVHSANLAIAAPTQIPSPDVHLWLIFGVLILAVWRFSTQAD